MPLRTSLSHCLQLVSQVIPTQLPTLTQDLPGELIQQALAATGTATVRRRRLPAEQIVWLVLGMVMFRHLNIVQVVDQLGLALAKPNSRQPVVPSAIHKARERLGPGPLAWLIGATARSWAHKSAAEHKFRGLSVYGMDGTTMRVPDSPENREHFGGTKTSRGKSGYPLCRLAVLMALRSHLIAAAAFGPYATGEHSYAQALWDQVPDGSVVCLDRGFLAAVVLYLLQAGGNNRHYLIRLKKNTKLRVLKKLGSGDELVQMQVSKTARQKHPELPETLVARRLVYQRKRYRPQALLTSMCDPEATLPRKSWRCITNVGNWRCAIHDALLPGGLYARFAHGDSVFPSRRGRGARFTRGGCGCLSRRSTPSHAWGRGAGRGGETARWHRLVGSSGEGALAASSL